MTRDEFLRRLEAAAARAIAFARELVVDTVPDDHRFDIRLVPHHDGRIDPPLESLWQRTRDGLLADQSADQVVAELWHDGRVPEWIDLSVEWVDRPIGAAAVTYLDIRCSRTVVEDTELWDWGVGLPPFKIAGPPIPPDFAQYLRRHGGDNPRKRKYRLAPRRREP